jgi:hypothetical protein
MPKIGLFLALFLWASSAGAQVFNAMLGTPFSGSFGATPLQFLTQNPAIDYNRGGAGIAYNVPAPGCVGVACGASAAAYRPDDVNFKSSTFTGIPFQIGFSASPNSFNYNINISGPGPYIMTLWLADSSPGGSWGVLIDGAKVGSVVTPNTGDHSTFQAVSSGAFSTTQGTHVLTLAWASGDTQFGGAGDIVAWQGGVVSTTSIACDRGPPYVLQTGAGYTNGIPTAANAAGMNHCVINIAPGDPQFATLANWIDACGASSPVMYAVAESGIGNGAQCNQFSIINDGGVQVLNEHWEPANLSNNNNYAAALQTGDGSGIAGIFVRGGYYIEATYRNTPASFNDTTPSNPFITEFWEFQQCTGGLAFPNCNIENDFDETYAWPPSTGDTCGAVACGSGSTWHQWNNGGSHAFATFSGQGGVQNGFDATLYKTIGYRVTEDNVSGVEPCAYINHSDGPPSLVACDSIGNVTPDQFGNRSFFIIAVGPQSAPSNSTMDLYVKRLLLFSCPAYQTTGCYNNPVLSSAP